MDREEFRRFGYRFVDWVADYLENVERFPVTPPVRPGEIRSRLPTEAPVDGEPMEKIFDDFRSIILPGMAHWQHPHWYAYFPANNSPESVLAELLTAGMGAQCMIWQTSPAAAELEETVLEWLRKMLGLPEGMTGVIQDTASTATLCALLTARENATGFASNRTGLDRPLTVYASEESHSSVVKAVRIAGFGDERLRLIATDDRFAMKPEALREAVERDRADGLTPAAVVATLGTTSSTAIDPLASIAAICREHALFLHVDAAFAGSACILPEKRSMLHGIEQVDSFVMNPHKWLLTNFDCSAYFVKDAAALTRTFEIHPEYLKTAADARVKNYRDWGIPLGRRFRALKLWFVLRSYGVSGLQAVLREHIKAAELLEGWVEEHEHFELMAPVPVSLVCFRFNDGRDEAALGVFNRRLLTAVNEGGRVFLTHTTLRGRYVLRMAIGQRTTSERHVREAWDWICSRATRVAGSPA